MSRILLLVVLLLGSPGFAPRAEAQLHSTQVLTLEGARRIATAAETEALRNGWNVAIAVVDAGGALILFQRHDGVQPASLEIAIRKARTAAAYKRSTKVLEDALAGGRTLLLSLPEMLPIEGGVPIVVDGVFVGAIGVSGVAPQQDGQIAQAGSDAVSR